MAEELNINPLVAALNGGEDYELIFTLSPDDAEKLKNDPDFTIIGEIIEAAEGYPPGELHLCGVKISFILGRVSNCAVDWLGSLV